MDLVPQALLDGVIRVFDPVQVILFGSRARGDNREDSDIDLYVVVDDDVSPYRMNWRRIGDARRVYEGDVDIVLARRSNHERRRHFLGALAKTVVGEGVLVYARP